MRHYTLSLYEKSMPDDLTWLQKYDAAFSAGYDFIEISIDESDARIARLYDPSEIEILKTLQANHPVKIRSLCLSAHRTYALGSMNDALRNKGMDIFYRAIDFASVLGINLIQLAGYDVYYDKSTFETEARFIEFLAKGIAYASELGVLCAFETMETDFMNTVSKAMKYVTLINSPYLGVYPDVGNLTNAALSSQKDFTHDLSLGRGKIVAAHLKETEPGVFRNMEFGEGHVDFKAVTSALWHLGVRRFGVEFWYNEKTDYNERLRHNHAFIVQYLDQLDEDKI